MCGAYEGCSGTDEYEAGKEKITVYSLQKTRLHHCKNVIHLKSQIVIKKLNLILTVSSVNIKHNFEAMSDRGFTARTLRVELRGRGPHNFEGFSEDPEGVRERKTWAGPSHPCDFLLYTVTCLISLCAWTCLFCPMSSSVCPKYRGHLRKFFA